MIHSEDQELKEARRLLACFDRHSTKPEGIAELAEALATLSDIQTNETDSHERRVATNLFATYVCKAEENADRLLSNFDSIPDEEVEQWHTVMQEFGLFSIQLPDSFSAKQAQLIKLLFKRLLQQLTPYQQQKLLEDSGSNRIFDDNPIYVK